jgi:hypothetical protein
MERLDEERIEVLRQWGEGLARVEREETRAAGRAILLLIEEIDRLHVDLWNQRAAAGAHAPEEALPEEEHDVHASLRDRLRQLRRRRSDEPATLEPGSESS